MTGIARLALPFPQLAAGLGMTSLVLAGLVWVQGQRMHAAKVERDQLKREARQWEAALETQRKSIETLKAIIEQKNVETERRFAAFQAAARQNDAALAAASARAAANERNVRALQAFRDAPVVPGATQVSEAFIESLKPLTVASQELP